jgi:hypothetical protein
MLQILLVLTVPENLISNDGLLRDLPPSEFGVSGSIFLLICRP